MTPIEYTGAGASGVTINGTPAMVVTGPRSLVESLLATGQWSEVGAEPKPKKSRKKASK